MNEFNNKLKQEVVLLRKEIEELKNHIKKLETENKKLKKSRGKTINQILEEVS